MVRVLMKIDGKWQPADLRSYDDEADLQALLQADPSLIPGATGSSVAREFPLGGGAVDLLCIDELATITLVECKLNKNREARRAVIGQVLAYAAALSNLSVEDFSAAFQTRTKTPLPEAISADAGPDFDLEGFTQRLKENLQTGSFRLVVAVDDITGELRGIIEYLNDHMVNDVNVLGLELGILRQGDVELLVPTTYGAEIEERERGGRHKKRWTEDDLEQAMETMSAGPQQAMLKRLFEHARAHGAAIKGGTGGSPSAGFYYEVAGKRRSVWSLYMRPGDPYIAINLGSVHGASPDAADEMLAKLKEVSELAQKLHTVASSSGRYPEFGLDAVTSTKMAEGAVLAALDIARSAQGASKSATEPSADSPIE